MITECIRSIEDGGNNENPRISEIFLGYVVSNVTNDKGEARVKEGKKKNLMPLKRIRGSMRRSSCDRSRREKVSQRETI